MGAVANAAAAPASESLPSPRAIGGGAPESPGGYTHLPRNGIELDNSEHPVTGQGPNAMTDMLEDTLHDAGIPGR
ncbi:MAG: hypothetical protein ACRC20_12530 [Segniliparus sp.]|uniref:hypothetical protein n=1 Tax=Segniliparus sp. TaxID=2804064 RepID=UPI003F4154AD